jgi:hypothetical protein
MQESSHRFKSIETSSEDIFVVYKDELQVIGIPSTDLITAHLSTEPTSLLGGQTHSALGTPLKEIRAKAGRDENSGKLNSNISGSWLAALGYLALIEQVGSCYNRPEGNESDPRDLVRAIRQFSKVSEADSLEVLYGLRCSLSHNYAIVRNDARYPKQPKYAFIVHPIPTSGTGRVPLIKYPATPWDGDYSKLANPDFRTMVSIAGIGDLFEEIFASVKDLHTKGGLRLRLPANEFFWKYFWGVGPIEIKMR